jgi:hypothetical protein
VLILKINFKNKKYHSNKKHFKKQFPSHFHKQLNIMENSNFTNPEQIIA